MTSKELNTVKKWFRNYVDTCLNSSIQISEALRPKLDHSLQVANHCRTLAEDLKWPDSDVMSAEAIGILHDVGRFSQFAEFGTFVDSVSVSHCERGYDIVVKSAILAPLLPRDRGIILNGIRYHKNKEFRLKAQTESLAFLRLLRDADRIDRFRITYELLQQEREGRKLTVESDGPINSEVINQIQRKKPVSKKNIITTLDFYLFRISSVFDVHYTETYKRISESRILKKIVRTLPDDKVIHTATKSILSFIDARVQS